MERKKRTATCKYRGLKIVLAKSKSLLIVFLYYKFAKERLSFRTEDHLQSRSSCLFKIRSHINRPSQLQQLSTQMTSALQKGDVQVHHRDIVCSFMECSFAPEISSGSIPNKATMEQLCCEGLHRTNNGLGSLRFFFHICRLRRK